MSSPEELIIEESSLGPGPVVSKLGDLGVEGPEGVSSDQQGRALPSRQAEVCLEAGFSTSMLGYSGHQGAYDRTFPCMKANHPSVIKNQRGVSKIPLVGGTLRYKAPSRGLWMPVLLLYAI